MLAAFVVEDDPWYEMSFKLSGGNLETIPTGILCLLHGMVCEAFPRCTLAELKAKRASDVNCATEFAVGEDVMKKKLASGQQFHFKPVDVTGTREMG